LEPDVSPPRCRRRHKRVSLELPVTLISTTYGTTNIVDARTVDVSESGLGVVSTSALPQRHPVSVEMKVPLQEMILKIAAEVLHRSDGRYGLRFLSLTEAQLNHLRRMVN
jgi:c-di-GMP-binding flagellar brake protein YcgR